MIQRFYKALFFSTRLYLSLGALVLLFICSFFWPALYVIALIVTGVFGVVILVDLVLLFGTPEQPFKAVRQVGQRFSHGDENEVKIALGHGYRFPVQVEVLDELPFQFQARNFRLTALLQPGEERMLAYTLRPLERGEYDFGVMNIFLTSPLGLLRRYIAGGQVATVKVYPAYLQLRHYELFSAMNRLNELGVHKRRVVGHSMEFDHIREYNRGDDVRMLNWKATARRGTLMVNNYVEEKAQQVYCVIDKGRTMKMPFDGISLLDYAINATLVFSNVALQKGDKAGLVTLSAQSAEILAASNKKVQLSKILEMLYAQTTAWQESDYETLGVTLRNKISQRSLLIFFTNFESMTGLQRQLSYLRQLSKYHLVLVIFFENTELKKVTQDTARGVEEVYKQVIAQKFAYEKKLFVRELSKYGILSLLTTPEHLTLDLINKYLELKSRMLI